MSIKPRCNKRKAAEGAGIVSLHHELAAETTTAELLATVAALNGDDAVDGILVQLPLPKHIDEHAVLLAIMPAKDVDGFHPENVARLAAGARLPGPLSDAQSRVFQALHETFS